MMQQQTNTQRRRGRPRAVPHEAIMTGTEPHLDDAEVLRVAVAAVRQYAETHPRPGHVTQIQAAEMLNLSRATVCRMVKAGSLKLNTAGLIPTAEVDRLLASR